MCGRWRWTVLAFACSVAFAQNPPRAPIASSPVVEVRGTIAKVDIRPGAGAPVLEVNTGSSVAMVRLGSIRYLMERNFNPKSGAEVIVKGYRAGEEIVAITVRTPANNREIRLRDENGWPLWRGGGPRWRKPN